MTDHTSKTMQHTRIMAALALCCALMACGGLSKVQRTAISDFSDAAKACIKYPSAAIKDINKIRLTDQINASTDPLYSVTLDKPYDYKATIDSYFEEYIHQRNLSDSFNSITDFLVKYAGLLKDISDEAMVTDAEKSADAFQAGFDTCVARYKTAWNKTNKFTKQLIVGRLVSGAGKIIIRRKQLKYVREAVSVADTLISDMTADLVTILSQSNNLGYIKLSDRSFNALYITELQRLQNDTILNLQQKQYKLMYDINPRYTSEKEDRVNAQLNAAACIVALQGLRKTHGELKKIVDGNASLTEFITGLDSFYKALTDMRNLKDK